MANKTITALGAVTGLTGAEVVPVDQTTSGNTTTYKATVSQIVAMANPGTFGSQVVNTVFAGPGSGGSTNPTFRVLVTADLPSPYSLAPTGTGVPVLATTPTLVTPILGVATATSINKVTITAPATSAVLTIADGKTLTVSNSGTFSGGDAFIVSVAAAKTFTVSNTLTLAGTDGKTLTVNASLTLTGTDAKTLTLSNSGTLSGGDAFIIAVAAAKTLTVSNTLTFAGTDSKSLTLTNSLTVSGNDGTLSFGAASKTFAVNNTLTLAGTDSTTMTFPATSTTVAGLSIAQSFTAQNTFAAGTITTSQPLTVTQTWNAGGVTFNGLLVNVVSSASAAASTLIDLQVSATSQFKVTKGGSVNALGAIAALTGTAVPAGGTAGSGFLFSSVTNLGVFFGSGAPTLSAAQGSVYVRTDGSSTSTRLYINTNGATTWTNVTTAA